MTLKQTTNPQFKGTWADRLDGLPSCIPTFAGMAILDVGCNMGLIGYEISKQRPFSYCGIDVQQAHIDCARMIWQAIDIPHSFKCLDLIDWHPKQSIWDVTLCLATRQHVEKQHGRKAADTLMKKLFRCTDQYLIFRGPDWQEAARVAKGFGMRAEALHPSDTLHPLVVFQ